MLNIEEIIKSGFKIINGRLCDRYGNSSYGAIDLMQIQWTEPGTAYRFDHYELNEYTVEKSVHFNEWYLKKGYQEVCKLYYYGGKNWSSF